MILEGGSLKTRARPERAAFCVPKDLDFGAALQCCPSAWQFTNYRLMIVPILYFLLKFLTLSGLYVGLPRQKIILIIIAFLSCVDLLWTAVQEDDATALWRWSSCCYSHCKLGRRWLGAENTRVCFSLHVCVFVREVRQWVTLTFDLAFRWAFRSSKVWSKYRLKSKSKVISLSERLRPNLQSKCVLRPKLSWTLV